MDTSYTATTSRAPKVLKIECAYIVCTQMLVASPLISGAAGDVYVSRSMQIKIGFSYANRAKCFCKSTCLCVCKSGASNVSINNVHRLN